MEAITTLFLALLTGFTHAFEADHLVAVSAIVTRRKAMNLAIKDGIFWGFGHTSTILLMGCSVLLVKVFIQESTFSLLEGVVGLMLILLGVWRVIKFFHQKEQHEPSVSHSHSHRLAYMVGSIHGLAGSGALIVLVAGTAVNAWYGILYLILFGLGSVIGMMTASGIFSYSILKGATITENIYRILSLFSGLLCLYFGWKLVAEHLLKN